MNNQKRVINTKVVPTLVKLDIMNSIMGQLSDGIWENNPRAVPYWWFADMKNYGDTIRIEISNNYFGNCGNWYARDLRNPYWYKTDAQILEYFKRKLKEIVKEESKQYNKNRVVDYTIKAGNYTHLTYLSYSEDVTINDVYEVIQTLNKAIKELKANEQ